MKTFKNVLTLTGWGILFIIGLAIFIDTPAIMVWGRDLCKQMFEMINLPEVQGVIGLLVLCLILALIGVTALIKRPKHLNPWLLLPLALVFLILGMIGEIAYPQAIINML